MCVKTARSGSKNKVITPSVVTKINPQIKSSHHGLSLEWTETTYESSLLDGTPIDIKYVNFHRYNLQSPFYNHYSYFELK